MIPVPEFVERRKTCRLEINLDGIVKSRTGATIPCTVKNVSSMGAFLEFERPTILPKQFKLAIAQHMFEAECEVRHRTPTCVGVLFSSNRREALACFASPFQKTTSDN